MTSVMRSTPRPMDVEGVRQLGALDSVALAGNALRGPGMSNCIDRAERAVQKILADLGQQKTKREN